ncbi:MAG: hypothetical protein AAF721_19650 [Myxococcota bacterium]
MGHVAVQLAKRVAPGRVGLWRLLRPAELRASGFADWGQFAAAVADEHPMQIGGGGRITHGVLWTSEPAHARALVAGLAVARSLADAAAMLRVATP